MSHVVRTSANLGGRRDLRGLLAAIAIACLGGGCAHHVVHANRLPARYHAAQVTNARTVDLSRLSVPTTPSDMIEPQDVIDVTIASGIETAGQLVPTPVRLDDEGVATIALLGPVHLAGLEPFAAEQAIATAAIERGLYKAPQVTVTMRKKAVNRITVIGAVENQGVRELPRGQSTLLTALVAAGALSERAGTVIEVRRHDPTAPRPVARGNRTDGVELTGGEHPADDVHLTMARTPGGGSMQPPAPLPPVPEGEAQERLRIDLADLDPTKGQDVQLRDGDIVRVETRDPVPVNVIGLVRKPGQYEMPVNKPLTVLDAIAMAGERSNPWADKILVTRQVPGDKQPVVIRTSMSSAKHDAAFNIRLAPGDVVSVEETAQTTLNYIITGIFRFGVGTNVPLF
jgi:polysaccharide export outer membrane protein